MIAGKTFTLDVAAQLVPPTQNIAWGGDSGKQYAVVANLGDDGPDGLGFILGMTFMERYYTVSCGSSLEKRKLIDSLLAGVRCGLQPRWVCSNVSRDSVSTSIKSELVNTGKTHLPRR